MLHYHNKGATNQHKYFDNLFYHFLFKNTKVILLSKRLYNDVSKYVKKEDVYYCPNGIPIINFKKEISINKNSIPKLLFLSNLIESKGVYVLLEALKILKNKKGLKFNCKLVGGEGDISIAQLNHKIKNLELKNYVTYLGKKYDEDKYDVFQSSHFLFFPLIIIMSVSL